MDVERVRGCAERHARALAASDFGRVRRDLLTVEPPLAEAIAALPDPVTALELRWVDRHGQPAILSARAVR